MPVFEDTITTTSTDERAQSAPSPTPPGRNRTAELRDRAAAQWRRASTLQRVGAVVGALLLGWLMLAMIVNRLSGSGGTPTSTVTSTTVETEAATPADAEPVAGSLVLKSSARGPDDPFRGIGADIHPIVGVVAGGDANRLRNAVGTVQAQGAQLCDVFFGLVGPNAGRSPIDLGRPAEWEWMLFDAAKYADARFDDGRSTAFPTAIAPVPVFVNGACRPLSMLPDPEIAAEQTKAAAAAAAAKAAAPTATAAGQ